MGHVTLVTIHNAFDRTGRDTKQLDPGWSLEELQTLYLPAAVDFALSVNGRVVTDLATVPRGGDLVTAVPVVLGGGGDSGKMIGRIIGMVILAVISYGIGALANAGYLGYSGAALAIATNASLVGAAVMMVGGMLLNMAFAASGPGGGLQTYGDNANSSPAYSWAPQSTQQQGTVIPKWYGKNKLYGNITVAHIEYVGNDSYINALINLGFGPFKSLASFQVNDQPVENFIGVQVPQIAMGNLNQSVLEGFTDTVVEYNTSQIAAYGVPAIYTTQGNEFDKIEVFAQFPRGLGHYEDNGSISTRSVTYDIQISLHDADTWRTIGIQPATVQFLSGWSLGKWIVGPLATPRIWVKYDVVIPDWAYSYDGYDSSDTYITGFITTGAPFIYPYIGPGYVSYMYSADGTQQLEMTAADFGTIFPGATWQWFSGENVNVSDAGTSYTEGFTATGNQTTPLRISHSIPVVDEGRYDVKLIRLTPDFTSSRDLGELYLAGVKEVTGQSFTYPRQVLVGLKALATNQLSGSLRFSCLGECSLVRVWDGAAWSNQYSTNPAWVCYDVLTQPVIPDINTVPVRYDGIDPSRIDHVKFKEWADYCDELLPDGTGGTEKRIEFNGGFDSEMSLWEAVLRITTTAYAIPIWNGIKLTVSIDQPADPVQLFSLGNIDQDSFKETFLPMEDRAAEIEVDFVNQENNYQRDKLTVFNTAMDTVTSKVNLSMFGVTKPSMAWRNAMRKLAYNQHIGRTIDFGADIDAIACTVGDVILVQHDVPQWGYGGRIVSATTTAITIDQTITLAVDTQYAILVRMSDDSLVERDITNAPGDAAVLTVSPPFDAAPVQFDVFTVGEILKTAKPFRVSNISRSSDLKAQISAVEYVAGIYNVDYDIPVVGALDYTQPLTTYKQALPPFESVTGLAVVESLRKYNSGQVVTIATIYWTPVVNRYAFPLVEIWAWQDGTAPQKISATPISASSFEWTPPVDGVYWNIAVGVINLNGEAQPLSGLAPYRYFGLGKTAPPADITDLSATIDIIGSVTLSWPAGADIDLQGYAVRYSPLTTGAVWANSSEIQRISDPRAIIPQAQTGTYLVKAVDTSGNYSLNAAPLVLASIPTIIGTVPYALIDEAPAWGGTLTNLTAAAGVLSLNPTIGNLSGTYLAASEIDFGVVTTARVSGQSIWTLGSMSDHWDSISALDAMTGIDAAAYGGNVVLNIYTSQDASAPTFKQPLRSGDYTFRRARFELEAICDNTDTLIEVTDFTVSVETTYSINTI